MYMYVYIYIYMYTHIKWSAQTRLETAPRPVLTQSAEKVRWLEKGRQLELERSAVKSVAPGGLYSEKVTRRQQVRYIRKVHWLE